MAEVVLDANVLVALAFSAALAGAGCGGHVSSRGDHAAGNAGSSGSSAAANAGGSSAGTVGDGTAGTGGGATPEFRSCSGSGIADQSLGNSTVKETFQGNNGTFTDSCDATGNLVAYGCAYTIVNAGSSVDPGATYARGTGDVRTGSIDCGGRCRDGICPEVCPKKGDSMLYESINPDGSATLTDQRTGWTYTCGLAESGTGYDCANTPKPGDVTTANSDFKGCSSAATFSVGAQFLDCYYSPCTFTVP